MKKLDKSYYSKKDGKILEKGIQREICDYLHSKGFFFWRNNTTPALGRFDKQGGYRFRSMPKYSLKGVPDIIVIFEGRFIGIEVKRDKGTLSDDQLKFSSQCFLAGGNYILVHSLAELKEFFPFQ